MSPSGDPATNDFHLRPASPGINTARVISFRAGIDADGRTRLLNGATDRGAYQLSSTDATPAGVALRAGTAATPAGPRAPVPAPTFGLAPGTYSGAIKVALLTRTPGAYIRYTTDGSMPTVTTGILAGHQPVTVAAATTIKAVAFIKPDSGRAPSTAATGAYVIRGAE